MYDSRKIVYQGEYREKFRHQYIWGILPIKVVDAFDDLNF